jgi:hypothetical protein
MKPLVICLILLFSGWKGSAQADNNKAGASKLPDPPFLNHVYACRGDSLVSLEQGEAQMKSKSKGLGFGGSESVFEMSGEKSQVRIAQGDQIRFAIKLSSMMDPGTMIKLYRFEPKKGNREALYNSQSGPYSKKESRAGDISYNVQKSGNDVYLMLPAASLKPGEYGFLNMMMINHPGSMKMSVAVFAFGVD